MTDIKSPAPMESRANLGERLRSIEHHLSAGGKLDSKDADDLLAIARAQSSLLKQMAEMLDDGCLWVDEMQVGVNKWAGDAVGILARQDNLNAWRKNAGTLLASYHQAMGNGEGE